MAWRWRALLIPLALAAALVAAACGGDGAGEEDGRLDVVASIPILADMVQQVGGERVSVRTLVSGDPHTFSPRPQDAQALARADLVVMNGLGLEPGFERLARGSAREDRLLVLTDGLPRLEGGDHGHDHEEDGAEDGDGAAAGDPHYWLNPRYGMLYVERIRDALIAADPDGREAYQAGADRYLRELEEIDREFEEAVERIPPERRKLVTAHRAFGHLAERYGLEQVGFVVSSPEQQASAAALADLVRQIRAQGVPAVFREPQIQAGALESAAREAGVEVRVLLSDSFGEGVTGYADLLRFNMRQLAEGLAP
ncbi:MAG TPA: metal ABC transporter substrate-binding protein [Dehalococcoidia bacterium]